MDTLLETATPCWSADDAEAVALARFGVSGAARLLTSERDQNFHIVSDDGEFVLKVANAAENQAVLAFQNDVLEHVAAVNPRLPTPRIMRTLDGEAMFRQRGSLVRMLSWQAGKLMHQVERTRALRESLGAVHGDLSEALRSMNGAPPETDLLWDMQGAARLEQLLPHVADSAQRAMLDAILSRFADRAEPALKHMRRQVIHNDLNPHNVVVDEQGLVSGVIDFGDMVYAPRVCDIAVTAAYHVRAGLRPLADAGEYVRAFHAVAPLEAAERAVLPDLIATRLAMSALITNWRAGLYPENRAYILRNAPIAWAGVEAMTAPGAALEISL
ncbi:MAG TPA: phosphotransferase [Caulobacterales bacterium]|nr:phosphotransferase [Caulobacterales bacterium]